MLSADLERISDGAGIEPYCVRVADAKRCDEQDFPAPDRMENTSTKQSGPEVVAPVRPQASGSGASPDGLVDRLVCVGDVHGNLKKLRKLWTQLEGYLGAEELRDGYHVVFLGGYRLVCSSST